MDDVSSTATGVPLGQLLRTEVLEPLKATFVGKDEIIDLMGVCLAARENLFLLGPPGTAKSALVQALADRIHGSFFDYLLTRFTEPNEVFGPFDIRRLREGELETNTAGMLPEADFVFLDELLNANSAILNSLLLALNERVFRRGREKRALPTLMVVGASNHLPEDEALQALFDRFLVRVGCHNVPDESLSEVLVAGWRFDRNRGSEGDQAKPAFAADELRRLHRETSRVELDAVRSAYVDLIAKLRSAGIRVSDRRAVRFQRLVAASAVLCGRISANRTDLWVLRYTWDTENEREVIASLVSEATEQATDEEQSGAHPRSSAAEAPDVEELNHALSRIAEAIESDGADDRSVLRDRLTLLTSRCQWVPEAEQRLYLEERINDLWRAIGTTP